MTTTRDLFTGMRDLLIAGTADLCKQSTISGARTTPINPMVQAANPDRQLVITPVAMTDDLGLPLGLVMFQLKGRGVIGDPLDVHDLMDECFPILQGLRDITWGTTHIVQMRRTTSVPSTQDDLKRWERIDQYYADVDYPQTALRNASGY